MDTPFAGLMLSQRERIWPGTIATVTGHMTVCAQCWSRYRRMSTSGQAICGRCWPGLAEPPRRA